MSPDEKADRSIIARVEEIVRRRVRGIWWSRCYPIALPHAELGAMDGGRAEVLRLCDGTRTVREVSQASGCGSEEIMACHEEGLIVLWPMVVQAKERKQADKPRMVIVSPHPDDAALSVGGMMLRHQWEQPGDSIAVVDVFSRTAWWRYGAEEAQRIGAVREAEERLMARLTGVDLHMVGLPEALLRGWNLAEVFAAKPREMDWPMAERIAEAVRGMALKWRGAEWWLPLGSGGHVDHRLARNAAMAGLGAAGVGVRELGFYEDLPYAVEGREMVEEDAWFADRLVGMKVDIEGCLRWKLELCRVYGSQLTWSRIERLSAYARQLGGERAVERVWRIR